MGHSAPMCDTKHLTVCRSASLLWDLAFESHIDDEMDGPLCTHVQSKASQCQLSLEQTCYHNCHALKKSASVFWDMVFQSHIDDEMDGPLCSHVQYKTSHWMFPLKETCC